MKAIRSLACPHCGCDVDVTLSPGVSTKAPPDPRIRQFLVWFTAEYKTRRHGADYLVVWGRDGKIVKDLLAVTSYERLQQCAQILLSDKLEDPWVLETDRGIGILAMKFNWLSERLARWEASRERQA